MICASVDRFFTSDRRSGVIGLYIGVLLKKG